MPRRRRRAQPNRTPILIAVAAAVAATAALAARRFPTAVHPVRERIARRRRPAHETWSCECGQVYRVTGAGRHRIYWPEGAPDSEPLLIPECVNCERPLPTH